MGHHRLASNGVQHLWQSTLHSRALSGCQNNTDNPSRRNYRIANVASKNLNTSHGRLQQNLKKT
jgi:hypothetical protein